MAREDTEKLYAGTGITRRGDRMAVAVFAAAALSFAGGYFLGADRTDRAGVRALESSIKTSLNSRMSEAFGGRAVTVKEDQRCPAKYPFGADIDGKLQCISPRHQYIHTVKPGE